MLFIFHMQTFMTWIVNRLSGQYAFKYLLYMTGFLSSLPHSFSSFSSFSASSVSSEAGWSRILAWDAPEGGTGRRIVHVAHSKNNLNKHHHLQLCMNCPTFCLVIWLMRLHLCVCLYMDPHINYLCVFRPAHSHVSTFLLVTASTCVSFFACVRVLCRYLVLLDACQVPAEAQADLTALPVLQEQHRYTNTNTTQVILMKLPRIISDF